MEKWEKVNGVACENKKGRLVYRKKAKEDGSVVFVEEEQEEQLAFTV